MDDGESSRPLTSSVPLHDEEAVVSDIRSDTGPSNGEEITAPANTGYGTFAGSEPSPPTPGTKVSGWTKLRGSQWKKLQVMSLTQRRLLRSQKRLQEKELLQEMGRRQKITNNFVTLVDRGVLKVRELSRWLTIWGSSLREIEGNLGSGVSTYFKVLVWMLKINVLCMVLGVALIGGPGGYMKHHHVIEEDTLYNKDDTECLNSDVVNGTAVHQQFINYVFQLITGGGWIEATAMFYGWYPASNITKSVHGVEETVYDFPLAFFIAGCSYFFLSILIMALNLSQLFQKSATEQVKTRPYCSLVLAGWDHTIQKPDTGRLKSITIAKSLREELRENEQKDQQLDCNTTIKIYSLRLFTNFLCLVTMVGTVYLYVFTIFKDQAKGGADKRNSCGKVVDGDDDGDEDGDGTMSVAEQLKLLWETYAASIVVAGSNVVFPTFFEFIGKWEMYQLESTRIAVTLFRMYIMKLFTISTYLYILYCATQPSGGMLEEWQNDNNTLLYNCWENYIGTQLYQLIMVDFIIACAVILFGEVLYTFLATRVSFFRERLGLTKKEFNIPREILDLVYKQMILWSGYFFSPLLPVVGVIEVVVIFYFKKASALHNLLPPGKVIVHSESISHINGLFLIAILFVFVFNGLIIFNFVPSITCGPFRELHSFASPFINAVRANDFFTRYIIDNLKMTSVLILIVIVTGLVIYYYKSVAAARGKMVELLKEQVRMEMADKQFILGQKTKGGASGPDPKSWRKESLSVRKSKLSQMASKLHTFAHPSIES